MTGCFSSTATNIKDEIARLNNENTDMVNNGLHWQGDNDLMNRIDSYFKSAFLRCVDLFQVFAFAFSVSKGKCSGVVRCLYGFVVPFLVILRFGNCVLYLSSLWPSRAGRFPDCLFVSPYVFLLFLLVPEVWDVWFWHSLKILSLDSCRHHDLELSNSLISINTHKAKQNLK